MSQEEMDQCWKNLAGNIKAEVLDKNKVEESKREAFPAGGGCAAARNTELESGEKIAGQECSPCSESPICSVGNASRRRRAKE